MCATARQTLPVLSQELKLGYRVQWIASGVARVNPRLGVDNVTGVTAGRAVGRVTALLGKSHHGVGEFARVVSSLKKKKLFITGNVLN